MKKLLLLAFCLVMTMKGYAQVSTFYDFSAVNSEGITLYYKITDEADQKVALSYKDGDAPYTTFTKLIVPDKVTDGSGKEYTVTGIRAFSYNTPYALLEELILPKTLEHVSWQPLLGMSNLKKLTVQGMKSHQGIFFQSNSSDGNFRGHQYEEIRLLMTTLPTPIFDYNIFNISVSPDTRVYVPTDCSALYKQSSLWNETSFWIESSSTTIPVPYYEEITIGPHGYTSYYLENENFEVPTGCTAYIVKGAALVGGVGKATVEAFNAGSIIPKHTGFILSGTAGSTIAYRAHVTGTEVDVTGNLLVGTATEQEFSGAGYKYYIFGNGSLGQGFYHQGTRDGNSIKVGAHRAGLRLPAGSGDFAPAKGIFIDFESATHGTVTAITSPAAQTEKMQETIVYDLQGRRVVNPSHGIYIVNGKKVVIK